MDGIAAKNSGWIVMLVMTGITCLLCLPALNASDLEPANQIETQEQPPQKIAAIIQARTASTSRRILRFDRLMRAIIVFFFPDNSPKAC